MAKLSLLPEVAAGPRLANCSPRCESSDGTLGPGDLLFSSGQDLSGLCRRCGRFVCGLCDLQLGSEHICPICFERGRADSGAGAGNAEWRYRDVLYDSIALTAGWAWILVWPVIVAALPAVIFLHVKYAKAPRSYLIPRSGWRFWTAYAGFVWLPLLIAIPYYVRLMAGRR